jgi:hypothetical protein
LLACTTRSASRDQFEKGCGWWRTFWVHPNFSGRENVERRFYWDNGAGIYYWVKFAGGKCVDLSVKDYGEGHFTKINNRNYRGKFRTGQQGGRSDAQRAMAEELVENFSLESACASLGLQDLWHATHNYQPS